MNPKKPSFKALATTEDRFQMFGRFNFKRRPDNTIQILGDWAQKNIIKITVPQLKGVRGAPKDGGIWVHKLIAHQIVGVFQSWEDAGLIHLVKSWAGSFYPRMIKGTSSSISNHSFGTAFDINAEWNGLGQEPAPEGHVGSLLALVEIASEWGIYWGGFFPRKDGMHFEVAKILPKDFQLASHSKTVQEQQAEVDDLMTSAPVEDDGGDNTVFVEGENIINVNDLPTVKEVTQHIEGPKGDQAVQINQPTPKPPAVQNATEGITFTPSTGLTKVGTWAFRGMGAMTIPAGLAAFLEKNMLWLILVCVLLVCGTAILLTIYVTKQRQKVIDAQIRANPDFFNVSLFSKEYHQRKGDV